MSIDPLDRHLDRARALGFLGPGPIAPHRAHAERLAEMLEAESVPGSPLGGRASTLSALDLGSGGGLPGAVLASRWDSSRWVLLDANERRTAFLQGSVDEMGLAPRVRVVRSRAEVAGRQPDLRGAFTLVTARSFGPPAVTAECAVPFLKVGGILAVSEPPVADPLRWPQEPLADLGLELLIRDTWAVFRLVRAIDERFPRREGLPAKRPLW